MDITAKQKHFSRLLLGTFAIRPDMRRFEGGQRPFLRDGTTAVAGVCHENAERSLPEAGSNLLRLTESCRWLVHFREVQTVHPLVHGPPTY